MQSENPQDQGTQEITSMSTQSAFKRVTPFQTDSISSNGRPPVWSDYISDIVRQRKTVFKRLEQQKELQSLKNKKIVKPGGRRVERNVIIIPNNSDFFYNKRQEKIRVNEKVKERLMSKESGEADEADESSYESSSIVGEDKTCSDPPKRKRQRSGNKSMLLSSERWYPKTSSSKKRKYKKSRKMSRFGPRGKYKMYTDEERETIYRYAEEYGPKQAVKMFGIDRRRIKRWMEKGSCRNIGGQGRSPLNVEMEEKLVQEIEMYCLKQGKYPKRKLIKEWALKFYSGDGDFKASKGWFDKFFRRNKDILQNLKDNY